MAGRDIRTSWVSFPVAAVVALLPGFYAMLLYAEALGGSSAGFVTFLLDSWFLLVVAVSNVNFLFNRDYYYRFSEDNYTRRLSFLRGLPIRPRTVVAGRAMFMTVALACGSPAFFLVPYLMEAEVRNTVGPAGYVWFVGIWLGYALLGAGIFLLAELGLSGKSYVRLSVAAVPALMVVIGLLEWILDLDAVARVAGLVGAYGPLPAFAALSIGAATLALLARTTTRRIERRDLPA